MFEVLHACQPLVNDSFVQRLRHFVDLKSLSFEGHLEKKWNIFLVGLSNGVLVPFRQFVSPLALALSHVGETGIKLHGPVPSPTTYFKSKQHVIGPRYSLFR